ncbi:MAG: 6,7-dimethyl-8-ribityllumazine synthase [Legionellaceae bacterium]|nr:6,7-dimethyl-8-ribityllumazine synthase [Legionellaceae bacterium]
MSGRILVVSSNVHQELSKKQLNKCLALIKKPHYHYEVETVNAGTYEIPFVIQTYHHTKPFDAYIALGLILKSNTYHYEYITQHINHCFTQFALAGIAVGNGIITGDSVEDLSASLDSDNPCLCAYPSAFKAVDYLIQLSHQISK